MNASPQLESPRLILRAWADDDVGPYLAMLADREVMRHMGAGRRHELKRAVASALASVSDLEARRDIRRLKDHWALYGWGEWAVEERESGTLIGRIGFKQHPDFDADVSKTEIGWLLVRGAWGRGYATEGAALALAQGFEGFGLTRVISLTPPGNRRSLEVMRRLGMSAQGRTRWRGLEVVWSAIERAEWESAASRQSAAAR